MRILYIANAIHGSGGLERVLSFKLSNLADQMGYEVHILTLNSNKDLFYNFSPGIKFHNLLASGNPVKYIFHYLTGIKRIIKEIKPDVISVCDDGLKGFFLPVLIGKPCPMIYERHASMELNFVRKNGYSSKLSSTILQKLMHLGAESYDKFVVLTRGNINDWKLSNNMVIPNPVCYLGNNKAPLVNKKVIAIGSHSFNKGYDRLLEIWKVVIEKYPEWILEVYGKIDPELNYKEQADKMGLSRNVKFYEPVKDIRRKYLDASMLVLTSRSEGFGMVLIEAMSYGIPCIAFDCPHGPADVINNNEDGFLVQNGDIGSFAQKIIQLIENLPLRTQMGSKGQRNVQRFNYSPIMKEWDRLFRSLVKP